MTVLIVPVIVVVLMLIGSNQAGAKQIFSSLPIAIIMLLFIVASVWHMKIGMQIVIEDYIHNEKIKLASVIANNFILTPSDEQHISKVWRLFQLPPEEIVKERPDIKYVLVRAKDFIAVAGNTAQLSKSNAVAQQLLTDREPPPNFQLLRTVMLKAGPDDTEGAIFARLYKIRSAEGADPVAGNTPAKTISGVPEAGESSL